MECQPGSNLKYHLAGLMGTILFDLISAIVAVVVWQAGSSVKSIREKDALEGKSMKFVVARLVKLGKPPEDSTALPHKKVPALPTGPKDKIPVSRKWNPLDVKGHQREELPPFAVEDKKLRKVFDTARAFARITDNPAVEGFPDGVPEGEVTDRSLAAEGDVYATKLYRIFKNLWVVPSLLSDKEIEGLTVKVRITIGIDLKIHDYKIVRSSGNSQFDASVIEIFKKFERSGMRLPEPPDEVAAKLFEGGLVIRFHGRDYGR